MQALFMQEPVLIVDDDPVQRRLSEATLARAGFTVVAVDNGKDALMRLENEAFSAVLLDMMMPGIDGAGVLSGLAQLGVATPVVVQTAQGSIDAAVRMVRAGAFDFLVKPVAPDRLVASIQSAMKLLAYEGKAQNARARAAERFCLDDLITKSPYMEKVVRLAARAATSNIPVLIEGESGVGKEMVARAIQSHSDRKSKAFLTVNCGAIPEKLVESILFGHEKGAFTGANERHDGKFVEADHGTLFLDEIGELPLDVQVKLLRAVQFNEIDPVGAKRPRSVDIRLISATNKNLIDEIKASRFREDLFYRLNVFPIYVPPLRERREDIAQLAGHFLKRYINVTPQSPAARISISAMDMLKKHDWPGNIRELENAIYRAVVLADGPELRPEEFPQIMAQAAAITVTSLTVSNAPGLVHEPEPMPEPPVKISAEVPELNLDGMICLINSRGHIRSMEVIEADILRLAIAHYNGQLSEVARRLGIGRSTLYRKIADFGLETVQTGLDQTTN
jgi:DNA-binding NtrC family response regulator